MKIKINSSVVKFNLFTLILGVLGFLVTWISGNMELLNSVLTVEQVAGVVAIVNVINLVLRTTNTLGLKPYEIVKKTDGKEDSNVSD